MVLTGWQPTENWQKYNSRITQGSLKRLPLGQPGPSGSEARSWVTGTIRRTEGQVRPLPEQHSSRVQSLLGRVGGSLTGGGCLRCGWRAGTATR
jgi:hypothetical protein